MLLAVGLSACESPESTSDITEQDARHERDTIIQLVQDVIPGGWYDGGEGSVQSCTTLNGADGVNAGYQITGPIVEDLKSAAQSVAEALDDRGYEPELIHRSNENPDAWVVQVVGPNSWYFAVDFRSTHSTITAESQCYPSEL